MNMQEQYNADRSEALRQRANIVPHYVSHTVGAEERLRQLRNIVNGNPLQTGWDWFALEPRALDQTNPRSISNAAIIAIDGAAPLAQEAKGVQDLLAIVNNPDHPYGTEIRQMFEGAGFSIQERDRLLKVIEVYWAKLPVRPGAMKNHTSTLLHGDPYSIPSIPYEYTERLIAGTQRNDLLEREEEYLSYSLTAGTIGAVSTALLAAGLVSSIIDKQRFGRRAFFAGGALLTLGITAGAGYNFVSSLDKIAAFNTAQKSQDSNNAELAVQRFDAALDRAIVSAHPESHNVFRSLVLLTKLEEALERGNLGLPANPMGALVMGTAHIWDRQYSGEFEDKQKRAQFVRSHVRQVLVPTIDAALAVTPGAGNRDQVITELYKSIAAVDVTRVKQPNTSSSRFPRSLLDQGIITPIASYQSTAVLRILS